VDGLVITQVLNDIGMVQIFERVALSSEGFDHLKLELVITIALRMGNLDLLHSHNLSR
jgi:hypothetical protein